MKLTRSSKPITCSVKKDIFTAASEKAFDCTFDGVSTFYPWNKPLIPDSYKLGVIVGSSGSGKSTLLKNFGWEGSPVWHPDTAIISHFKDPDDAINRMGAVGLNSIPTWHKPYSVLSTGEKFRADLSRKLRNYAIIDEFSSVVDRDVAKAASVSLSKYIEGNDIHNVVLATCHRDVLDWLQPTWVIDTDAGEFIPGFFLSGQKSKSEYSKPVITIGTCLRTIII